jgi:hypothetical protein
MKHESNKIDEHHILDHSLQVLGLKEVEQGVL